jgi:hypothetical protein
MGALFLTTYSLALGDPVPHRIDAALVGHAGTGAQTVDAVQGVASDKLAFRSYASLPAALHAIDEQRVYAALDLEATRPTLYVASAAGASVARVLERISAADPSVRVVDTHPLAARDPNGVDIFYRMLVATIIGFLTVFQVRAQAGSLTWRQHTAVLAALAIVASLVLTFVGGVAVLSFAPSFPEEWAILAVQILAVASFASVMSQLLGRWALLPTWLFFVVLGNSSSGGAVSPPLLPAPFGFVSQWLPSGATVTSLRDAVYFRSYQHGQPIAVLVAWALVLFTAWLVVARRNAAAEPRSAGLQRQHGGDPGTAAPRAVEA